MFAPLAGKSRNNATGSRAAESHRQTRAPVPLVRISHGAREQVHLIRRAIGNQAALRQLAPPVAAQPSSGQSGLAVGRIDDPLEHEADRVAAQVMSMAAVEPVGAAARSGIVRRACGQCAAEEQASTIRRKPPASPRAATAETAAPPLVHQVVGSSGQPLDARTRQFMEPRFGRSFAQVQVHNGPDAAASAQMIGARAYTVGDHIVFNAGEFAPNTSGGRHLLAHELAHAAQQSGTSARREVVRRESFDLAGTDVKSCQDKVANDVGVCSDKSNTACTLGGVMTAAASGALGGAAGGTLVGGPIGTAVGGILGGVVGGIAGGFAYGKCVEVANAKCRSRGAAATMACEKKFAPKQVEAPAAGPPAINVNDLPNADPPAINVNDLPDAK